MRKLTLVLLLTCAVTWAQAPAKKAAARPVAKPAAPANPTVVFDTTAGKLRCTLFADKAPQTVSNFIGLAEGTKDWNNPFTHAAQHGRPMYNGTVFHRVIPNFMIQGGDPEGDGNGDVGFTIADEFDPSLTFDRPGRLAMANEGAPHTGASQFFITEVPTPHLNPCFDEKGCMRGQGNRARKVPKGFGHTIFGQCDPASVALVRKIARMPRDERDDRPIKPVAIKTVTIVRPGQSAPAAAKPSKPAATKKK